MRFVLPWALVGCGGLEPQDTDSGATTVQTTPEVEFPLPDDIADVDWVTAFQDAARLMLQVNTNEPWAGHRASLDVRQPGCPDFWTDPFTSGGVLVGRDYGVSWYDDCETDGGLYFSGWVWWDFDVTEFGDRNSLEGHTAEASRILDGDGIVGDADGVRFEFDGTVSDSMYQLEAYGGFEHYVYSSAMDATVTGRDAFAADSVSPNGYRTDLVQSITGGDYEIYNARGNVYLFQPQILDRFDSIEVDMELPGALGAGPGDCTLEPLGWIGVRDPDAIWYDVVFLPRHEETITGEPYDNDLSVCDGCGRLYVQGIEQDIDVCVDFSFVFQEFVLPDPDDYVLPLHAL